MNKDNKKFVIETIFLKEALKHDLTVPEFLVLVYFDNDYDSVFNLNKVVKATCLKEEVVLEAFDSLINKGIISLNTVKNDNGKIFDQVSLENLYNDIKNDKKEEEKKKSQEAFLDTFQKQFGHNLSSMDYEIIKAWLDDGFSEELILGALQEAIYKKVYSLKYIDKILFAWKKKGFKTMNDVNESFIQKDDDDPKFETSVMEFDWLDNEE
jgi:DNA replication protein